MRWRIVRWATSSAISGMNWAALAPVPMTTTRLPRRSTSWSHRAEWKTGPAKVAAPGRSGMLGRLSWPTPLTTASASMAVSRPSASRRWSVHVMDASSSSMASDLGAEADERPEPVLVGHATEVVEQHLLGGEVLRPVVPLRERVAVEEVRHVDAAARVRVLEPGATDVVVLLQHDDLDAGLVQSVGCHQSGHPGADDGDPEGPVGGDLLLVPRRGAEVLAERQLVAQQLEVVVAGGATGDEGEQSLQLVERQRADRLRRSLAQPLQRGRARGGDPPRPARPRARRWGPSARTGLGEGGRGRA